jgi:4'-phosphopantetheinyl transferase EntD
VIEQLLTATVQADEAFDDLAPAPLIPEEERALGRSVAKRRREFATVRACARRALGRLGIAPVPIVPGERGAPQWPAGVVGSMTHCEGYRAAAVALATDIVTIGVDAEPHEPLPDGVLHAISRPVERLRLAALTADRLTTDPLTTDPLTADALTGGAVTAGAVTAGAVTAGAVTAGAPGPCWDRLLFCVKEAVYKAWFPLTHRWLGFEDVDVTIHRAGTFDARLLVPGPIVDGTQLRGFTGRWLATDGLAIASIVLARQPADRTVSSRG